MAMDGTETIATVPLAGIELLFERSVPGQWFMRSRQLRGALSRAMSGEGLFNQRNGDGMLIYRYPHVQYRWLEGHAFLIGWREAAERLVNLPWPDLELRLGHDYLRVLEAVLHIHHARFGISDRLIRYELVTPMLLFNQKNYYTYKSMDVSLQASERDRLLVAQLLTTMRGLHINFPTHLYASFASERLLPCRFKGKQLMGVAGTFVTNAILPAGLGIGHATSHGFGWLVPSSLRPPGRLTKDEEEALEWNPDED